MPEETRGHGKFTPSRPPFGLPPDHERVKSEQNLKRDAELAQRLSARALRIDPDDPHPYLERRFREILGKSMEYTRDHGCQYIGARGMEARQYFPMNRVLKTREDDYRVHNNDARHALLTDKRESAFNGAEVILGVGIGKIVYNRRGRRADKAGGKGK